MEEVKIVIKNPIAKNFNKFNRCSKMKDKKKALKNRLQKHKNKGFIDFS